MRKISLALIFLLSTGLIMAKEAKKLNIGDKATLTEVKLKAVSGEMISIADAAKGNGLLLIFSCNTCPFVVGWEDRYNELKNTADKNNVGMIVLNSNYQKRDGVDSFEEMQKHAKEQGYNFDYVVDQESNIANEYGGKTTPHVYMFDKNMNLVYKGAIDDNMKNKSKVKETYVLDALGDLGAGKELSVTTTKAVGCSIKRK